MSVRAWYRPFLALPLVVLLAACSKAPADGSSPAAQGGRGNACQLLDAADMERLHGAKVTMLHNIEADDRTVCEVYDAANNQAFFHLDVTWKGGAELVRTEGTARGVAAGLLGGGVNLEPLIGASGSAKAADKAYYSDAAPSWVLKGDVLMRFRMEGLTLEQRKDNFVPLARKALDRLP
jgi:hypothetical protein